MGSETQEEQRREMAAYPKNRSSLGGQETEGELKNGSGGVRG
jgi:hypothetical protein